MRTSPLFPALPLALVLALTGCGADTTAAEAPAAGESSAPAASSTGETGPATADQPDDAPLAVADPWVKAAQSGMTGAFATITNTTGAEVTVTAVTSPTAPEAELHETVMDENGATVMQEKQGGFTIPAGGTLTLQPGADHLMLMGLSAPILPGDVVPLTLTLDDGTKVDFEADVKEFVGAQEVYRHENGETTSTQDRTDTDHGSHG